MRLHSIHTVLDFVSAPTEHFIECNISLVFVVTSNRHNVSSITVGKNDWVFYHFVSSQVIIYYTFLQARLHSTAGSSCGVRRPRLNPRLRLRRLSDFRGSGTAAPCTVASLCSSLARSSQITSASWAGAAAGSIRQVRRAAQARRVILRG